MKQDWRTSKKVSWEKKEKEDEASEANEKSRNTPDENKAVMTGFREDSDMRQK